MTNRTILKPGLSRAISLTLLAAIVTMWVLPNRVLSQNAPERKVVNRVEPEYPDTLKRLYIGGVVRVEIVVGSNGNVQTTELLGGNPILGQSAMKALKQWRYEAGTKEKMIVQMEFDPHNSPQHNRTRKSTIYFTPPPPRAAA
jgi:TonB family protein